jgi:hypothetical protein
MLASTKKFVWILLLAGVVALLATIDTHIVRDDGGADLLWNRNEADLFVYSYHRGFRISYLTYPLVILKQYLNGPPLPDNEKLSAGVIHVTSSGIKRYDLDLTEGALPPSLQTPWAGQIYANCRGSLCRWAGTHFEPASEEEKQKLDGLNRLVPNDIDGGADGWSKRAISYASHDYQISVEVGRDATLHVDVKNAQKAAYSKISVDLVHTGQAPERVWYQDGYPKRVSKAEYQQLFGKH